MTKFLLCLFCVSPLVAWSQCIQGNCYNGTGTYVFPSGSKYQGTFRDGVIQGTGILYFSNGDRYNGQWNNQYREGKGTLVKANGEQYTGEFYHSKFNGQGTYTYPDGRKVVGQWKDGKSLNEDGQINPVVNTANTSSPPEAGNSTLTENQPDGKVRDCNREDCQSGPGKYTYRDGSYYIGSFVNGQPRGEGVCYYANGDRYEGQWQNHAPHGPGIMYFHSGRVISAIWSRGRVIELRDEPATSIAEKNPVDKDSDPDVKIWAAVVGVASYNHMPTLKYTDDDAYRMYAFLKSPEGGALPDNQIRLMIDEDATRRNIIESMQTLFMQADENDVVMLYLSGHGLKGSFLPYDFDGYHNRLRYEDVQTILSNSPAKQKICLADACYAGTLGERGINLQQALNQFYERIDQSQSGTAFLMSSSSEEVSLEDQGLRQGIFSHYLIEGLKGGADQNQDRVVQLGELFDFVTNQVKSYTQNRQSPMTAGRFDPNLPMAFIR